jgi:hypothetical protein
MCSRALVNRPGAYTSTRKICHGRKWQVIDTPKPMAGSAGPEDSRGSVPGTSATGFAFGGRQTKQDGRSHITDRSLTLEVIPREHGAGSQNGRLSTTFGRFGHAPQNACFLKMDIGQFLIRCAPRSHGTEEQGARSVPLPKAAASGQCQPRRRGEITRTEFDAATCRPWVSAMHSLSTSMKSAGGGDDVT